ncbi:MAG TPA: PQQ-dependent sugar dehydrogenase [Burkholderiaceae bacterium]|nr:PQQ-dependent sugar dehydrogenase [Burkholderiaceae bacterium]
MIGHLRLTLATLGLAGLWLLPALPVQAQDLRPVTVARGLQSAWAFAFLPEGRLLVTERPGRMRVVEADGTLRAPLAGLPAVAAGGQGGLLDVALHPRFAQNGWVYWSYAEAGEGGAGTAVARGRLDLAANRLQEVQVIFRQQPKVSGGNHFGSRLAFAPDGRLFVGLGDRFHRKDDAQDLSNHLGKIVRLEDDGRVPRDNPFAARAGARGEIWSYGHRNVQGAAIDPRSGALWATEHGPQGGDELNLPAAGANHGWPVITTGRNYGLGTAIGEGTARADVAPPLAHWVPTSIAPSGLAFLTSDRYPGWKGQLFLGALRGQKLVRLELDGHRVVAEHAHLQGRARLRDVRQGPDGWLYVLTDGPDGELWRLER